MRTCYTLIAVLWAALWLPAQETEHSEELTESQLGTVHFASSCSPSVARSIERGVALLHSFWYEAAEKQFSQIANTDPQCAIAHWGIAMSLWHPLWNTQTPATLKRAASEIENSRSLGEASTRERAYIAALSAFYQNPSAPYRKRLSAYLARMERLYQTYPDDHEAAAFYALGLLGAGSRSGKGQTNREKAAQVLEKLFATEPNHPGVAHYLIHAYDSPEMASKGLPAARRYADIAPLAPHALHMPSHIFARLGLWQEDIHSNQASIQATEKEAARHMGGEGHQFHAMDFLVYAYLQTGREAEAKKVIAQVEAMPPVHDMYGLGFDPRHFALSAFPAAYQLELHHWREAAQLEPVQGASQSNRAITYEARAIGAARSGDLLEAHKDVRELEVTVKKFQVTKKQDRDEYDAARDYLQVARAWLDYGEGRRPAALRELRRLASKDEGEAEASQGIPRHEMLADMLLDAGDAQAALGEYELSLKTDPGRFDSLYGAARAAEQLGRGDVARRYYSQLVQNCQGSNSERAELAHAREAVELSARGSSETSSAGAPSR